VREDYASRIVEVYAFTSAKKMASVLVKHDESTLRLYNKGAAEWVLKRCVSLHSEYGEVVPMTEGIREQLLQVRRRRLDLCMLVGCGSKCALGLGIRQDAGYWMLIDMVPCTEKALQSRHATELLRAC
jgi:hypothetical protein